MNVEGITALVAAGAAVLGVGGAVLVGRWQLRAAVSAAQETARAGIVQAEATYRAALDAARATGNEAHAQWLRSSRRDAYAAFLLAAGRALEVAGHLADDARVNKVPPNQRDARTAELDAQISQLQNAAVIISLEGPDDVALHADGIADAALAVCYSAGEQFACRVAWHDLKALVSEDDCPEPIKRYYWAAVQLHAVREYGSGDVWRREEADRSDAVNAACQALQASRIGLPQGLWKVADQVDDYVGGTDETLAWDRSEMVARCQSRRTQFIDAARTILGPPEAVANP
ncbi:hypothetical protein ACGFZZ_26320 [Streptomyces tendae]|uniref:hypothetical protein n=1 Tax=Streptomyces tendae TaxID=1932 RepID=UPI003718E638